MGINIVVGMSTNRVIGRDGGLPWRLPADLQHFKAITLDHPIVMGRKTHESIGRALPGRLNIVVSRQPHYKASGCEIVMSFEAALGVAGDVNEIMIVGGASLYAEALSCADRIYLTEVHVDVDGDTVFPPLGAGEWRELSREWHSADEQNKFDYSFVLYERREEA